MTAKTHVNLGFLASILINVPVLHIPTVAMLLIFNFSPRLLRYVLLALFIMACIVWPGKTWFLQVPLAIIVGSIILDLDYPNSTGSNFIAPTEYVVRILIVAAGVTTVWFGRSEVLLIIGGLFLVVSGALNLKILPMEKIQRILLISAGVGLLIWSKSNILTALGIVYLLMGLLSHRGLTHSPEGVLLIVAGAWFFTKGYGIKELFQPFAIGVIAHYLADMIADHGVYLSYIFKKKVVIPLVKTLSRTDQLVGLAALSMAVIINIAGIGLASGIRLTEYLNK